MDPFLAQHHSALAENLGRSLFQEKDALMQTHTPNTHANTCRHMHVWAYNRAYTGMCTKEDI